MVPPSGTLENIFTFFFYFFFFKLEHAMNTKMNLMLLYAALKPLVFHRKHKIKSKTTTGRHPTHSTEAHACVTTP